MTGRRYPVAIALVLAALWALVLGYGYYIGNMRVLDRAEGALTDLRLLVRGERPAPDLVTLVVIDDDTVAKKGGYPLPRAELAGLVEAIARSVPRVIALDLLLLDRGNDAGDAVLAKALEKRPSVIAAAAVFPDAVQSVEASEADAFARLPQAEKFLLPLKRFADHAATGVVNLITDSSGTPRGVPMLFRTADKVELSFPLRVAGLAEGVEPVIERDGLILGTRSISTDIDHVLPLAFYGRPGAIRTVSAAALLDGAVAPALLRDRIVLIGATVTGGGDTLSTPFARVTPSVEILATAIGHLTAGDGIRRDRWTRAADAALALILTLTLVALLAWQRSAIGLLLIAAVLLIVAAVNYAAFSRGIWLSAALPVAAAGPPALLFGAVQLWLNRQQAQYFAMKSDLLQRFQAPALRKWLTSNPDFLLAPVHQEAAIVFIDLSGYTALSETNEMDATQRLLTDFHALVDREVEKHGGVITSFLGDGAMILFGLPEATADDARNAALCCVDLCGSAGQWIESLVPSTASRIGVKVGAHFGPIVASRLGGDSHQHITATGDTVNVASRLMEVAAKQEAALAVSDDLLRQSGAATALREFGFLSGPQETRIRGRSKTLSVWLWRSDSSGLDESALLR
ncbi:MAG: adenylate/guanylate cyclase domain-containing protein [Bradyrhizobium sp.]|nr:adenylate/guanylate cyclase domain-containing protein [Bradyrhizobium sp.]